MRYAFPSDVQDLVQEQMASGKYASEDELLREALLTLIQEEAELAAVRDALDDLAGGEEGIPLDEAFEAIRRPHTAGPSR